MGLVGDLIFIVAAAFIGGGLAHLCKQPLLVGYIAAGILVGPYTAGPTVVQIRDIELLAEIGVGLLLFTVGLEFSFSELARYKRLTLIVTPVQVLLCGFAGVVVLLAGGFSWNEAIWIGIPTALSSTMVVTKAIAGQSGVPESATRSMLGILIAQDVLVVPIIILLPVLVGGLFSGSMLALAIGKAVLFLATIYGLGTRLLPTLLGKLARLGSQELFFLAILSIALGTGAIAHAFGLSFALGGFIAGMLLSDTDFSHQALADVSGLRDLFGMVFFVSIGMLIDPAVIAQSGPQLFMITAMFVCVKLAVIWGLLKFFVPTQGMAPLIACGLAQIGEFAFVIGNEGVVNGILSSESRSLLIASAVCSMILTPQLIRVGLGLSRRMSTRHSPRDSADRIEEMPTTSALIIGGGSVAELAARSLSRLGEATTIVERDIDRLHTLRSSGMNVLFGDARAIDRVAYKHLKRASVALVTTTDDALNQDIIEKIRAVNEELPILSRVNDIEGHGVAGIPSNVTFVQPQVEAALEMVRETLLCLGRSTLEASSTVNDLRPAMYSAQCSSDEDATNMLVRQRAARELDLRWHDIAPSSPLVGLSLVESGIRRDFSLTIVAAIREGTVVTDIAPDFIFTAGDVVALLGSPSKIAAFSTLKGDSATERPS